MDNSTQSSNSVFSSIPILRFATLAVFFIVFQIVIILQQPFIQYDFVFVYYSCVLFLAVMYGLQYSLKIKRNPYISFLEISTVFCIYKAQPMFSSFYLVMILVLLFMEGLESDIKDVIFLVFATSVVLSAGNLLFFRWTGLQNILNLGLFNLAFLVVLFFSTQLKVELKQLTQDLSQTKLKLKSKAELAQLLIEHIPVGLLALDSKRDLVFINKVLEDNMKLNVSAMHDLIQLSSQSHQPDISYYNSELADKRYYQMETASYFDVDIEQKIDLYLVKDTTEVRFLQEQVRHKEKMAAVGQLAAGIAHEIRNPLAGISGSVELLSQDAKNPDDQKLMKIILKEIDRLNNLITDFLDYSKPESKPDQKIDLALILDEVLQNIKLSSATPAHLNYQVQIQSCYILGFPDKLKQVFLNIIVNAIQAMKDQPQPILKVFTQQTESQITVEIHDNGAGMTPETQKRIFEPFYTTKSKGTGLGLAITHKIIESHDAQVKIESTMNQGTQFKIIFNRLKS